MTGRSWIDLGDDLVFERLWKDYVSSTESRAWILVPKIEKSLDDSGQYVGALVEKGSVWVAPYGSANPAKKFFKVLGIRTAERRAYGIYGPSETTFRYPGRVALHRFGPGGASRLVAVPDLFDLI